MKETLDATGYQLDPHGAVAYRALKEQLRPGETGIFLETAHPAKFRETVESITGRSVVLPERLAAFMKGEKKSIPLPAEYSSLYELLLSDSH